MSAVSTFSRRRALSEPPRPNFRARIHRLSRLFEPRIAEADPDVEHTGDRHVVVVREEDDEYAQESEEDREKDAADEAEKEHHRGVVEGMYEHASASRSLLPQPAQAYKSMIKRSDQSLRTHLNESQVEVCGPTMRDTGDVMLTMCVPPFFVDPSRAGDTDRSRRCPAPARAEGA